MVLWENRIISRSDSYRCCSVVELVLRSFPSGLGIRMSMLSENRIFAIGIGMSIGRYQDSF